MDKNKSEGAVNKPNGLKKLITELQGLDVENYGNWSKPIQYASWGLTGVAAAVFGFLITSNSLFDLASLEVENREAMLVEFEAKQAKLAGAMKYKDQLVEIENHFNEQLQQLPKETEIPGLVDDLNRAGKQAGLKIETMQLSEELEKEFFIEQPIEIVATGEYHSFGQFVSLVSALPRIVTIQTFNASNVTDDKGNTARVPETKYVIKASTYRYLAKQPQPAANAGM